jgi:hypothetical protein
MNVPLTKMFQYLFKPNKAVEIKYMEDEFSGEIRVVEFLTQEKTSQLDSSSKDKYTDFTHGITESVRNEIRQLNFYRYLSIALLLLCIILPSLISYFIVGGHWVIIGGVYYSFFAYLLVEAYIQASRNYFEDQLYKEFQNNYLKK